MHSVVCYVKKQGNWEEFGATKLSTQGGPPDGPAKKRIVREAVKTAITDIAHGRVDPAIVMERDVNLWMMRRDNIMRMAQELKTNLKRKMFEQPDLRPWQNHAEQVLLNQDERKILFIVDDIGNNGKTWLAQLAQYMHWKHGAIIFDQPDQHHCVMIWRMEKIVIFDVPRSAIPSYSCMEAFKEQVCHKR